MALEERDEAAREAGWSALALSLLPIAPADAVRERLLQSLRGPERFTPFAAEVARVFDVTPEAAHEALSLINDTSQWRKGFLPGSLILVTPALQRALTMITRLPAGTRIPMHPHASREATFVLDGILLEDGTREHRPGAVLDMPGGTRHEIEVAPGADCLVVFYPAKV